MKIHELLQHLEAVAPPRYQESYDNAGLIVGDAGRELTGVLLCLDSTEAVVAEAAELGCNLIVAHHPIVFRGLKRLTGSTYVERVVMEAIRRDIAIYAAHTNLDNVFHQGVNAKIGEKLGLLNTRILSAKAVLKQLSFTAPAEEWPELEGALQEAGAEAVWQSAAGSGQKATDKRLHGTTIFPEGVETAVRRILEQTSCAEIRGVHSLENKAATVGSGLIGQLREPLEEADFLQQLKGRMQAGCVRHTALLGKPVQTVAVCGGAGGFLLPAAIAQGADVFVTADYKYHEFFDADGRIVIADIGHYESEQYTIELLKEIISEKFRNFAVHCTKVSTNPVQYL